MNSLERSVGTFSVDVEIGDPEGREFVVVNALVDTGATYSAVPGEPAAPVGRRASRRPGGSTSPTGSIYVRLPVGETTMRLVGKEWTVPVIFAPEDTRPLLGATALEIFSLVVDPNERRLVSNNALLMQAAGTG